MQLKRFKYLLYYFLKLDRRKFREYCNFVIQTESISKFSLYRDILKCVFRYNISILDYLYFRFYQLNEEARATYAGTGYMYEYQLKMNPKAHRAILENKLNFLKAYSQFIKHEYATKKSFLDDQEVRKRFFENKSDKLILKSSDGQCGEGIEVIELRNNEKGTAIDKISNSANDLIEEFIVQHDDLMGLSPAGLNTVRIITQLDNSGKVVFLGARLRITVDSYVDNLAAGNIAAPVDLDTGIVIGPAVYSDITKQEQVVHPITNKPILDFQIPYWKESIQMVVEAAKLHPTNRSIGWDLAITNQGPELLEGNHNWCKLLWQLPVKKGLKNELETYI